MSCRRNCPNQTIDPPKQRYSELQWTADSWYCHWYSAHWTYESFLWIATTTCGTPSTTEILVGQLSTRLSSREGHIVQIWRASIGISFLVEVKVVLVWRSAVMIAIPVLPFKTRRISDNILEWSSEYTSTQDAMTRSKYALGKSKLWASPHVMRFEYEKWSTRVIFDFRNP